MQNKIVQSMSYTHIKHDLVHIIIAIDMKLSECLEL